MALRLEKVLIPDPVHQNCVKLLEEHGISVTHGVKLTPEQLCQQIKEYDGIIVRSETKVTAQVLQSGAEGRLKLVGRAGTGVDNIDVQAATKLGIYVLNTPGGNSISACELTCALISSLARNVGLGVSTMKDGRWERKQLMGTELYGKTLAVIGLGRIGREVAHRMKSFGMKVIGFDPLLNQEQANDMGVELYSQLDDLWPLADYITLHVPLNNYTKDLISKNTFSKCKKSVKVVNVARGGIINERDLLAALEMGDCGGAALDVYTEEPPKSQHLWDLIKHPLVTPTPHLGASTVEAQVRVAEEIAQQFVALSTPSSGYQVCGAVNSEVLGALSEQKNTTLVSLARILGNLAASIAHTYNCPDITVHTESDGKCPWVTSCVVEGLIGTTGPSAKDLAKSKGLKDVGYFFKKSTTNQITVVISDISHTTSIKGTWNENAAYLSSIDDASFAPAYPLTENSKIIPSVNSCQTLQELLNAGKEIKSFGLAKGKHQSWICINL